ncbi:MAG: anti-sigma factor RsbA family regulatory protein [Pseudonocardiales bacterium]
MSVDFAHEALFYVGDADFVRQTAAFIADGVAAREPVLVVVAGRKIDALRDVLGREADSVLFLDMADVGLNPARIIPAWREFVSAHEGGQTALRGIGEPIWAERSPDELVECQRHESLINVEFDGSGPFRLLCPYDVSALDPAVLDEARRSHPLVQADGALRPSEDYRGTADPVSPFETPLPPVPANAAWMELASDRLHTARALVERRATELGMGRERCQDLLLAITEVCVNSLMHGRGAPLLSVWARGDIMLCQVTDAGRLLASPLIGRQQPSVDAEGGRGLWLANQLCDLVQVRALASGTAVRLQQRV